MSALLCLSSIPFIFLLNYLNYVSIWLCLHLLFIYLMFLSVFLAMSLYSFPIQISSLFLEYFYIVFHFYFKFCIFILYLVLHQRIFPKFLSLWKVLFYREKHFIFLKLLWKNIDYNFHLLCGKISWVFFVSY